MSEIEKMYEKCNFEKSMGVGSPVVLHPFTAEKELKLIKWLMKHDEIHGEYNDGYGFSTLNYSGKYKKDFGEALASVINNKLWQDLTPEEKQQVKGILE